MDMDHFDFPNMPKEIAIQKLLWIIQNSTGSKLRQAKRKLKKINESD